jgi:hypothetical protein
MREAWCNDNEQRERRSRDEHTESGRARICYEAFYSLLAEKRGKKSRDQQDMLQKRGQELTKITVRVRALLILYDACSVLLMMRCVTGSSRMYMGRRGMTWRIPHAEISKICWRRAPHSKP